MKIFQSLIKTLEETDSDLRKSLLLIYSAIFFFGLVFFVMLFYFLFNKKVEANLVTYAARQKIFSQKIAIDVNMDSDSIGAMTLVKADLAKMKENAHNVQINFINDKSYKTFRPLFVDIDKFFRTTEQYIKKQDRKTAREINQQSIQLYPKADALVKWLMDKTRDSDKKFIITMLALLMLALIAFVLMTIYKIVPHVKKYNLNHKAIIDNEYKLKIATEAASLGIYRHNIATNRLEWDQQMYQIYEVDESEEMTYEKWFNFLLEESKNEAYAQLNKTLKTDSSFYYEFKIKTPRGNEKYISTSGVAIKNENGIVEVVGVNADVTEVRNIQSELMKSKEFAMKANSAKSEFLANMSHEIRTPLNGIIGLSKILSETKLSPKQADYIQRIRSSSQLLLDIVNNILDFSKIEAKRVEITKEEFDLLDIFRKLSNMFGYVAYEKKILLKFFIDPEIPARLFGDELHISQILINIVANALKFTQIGMIRVYATYLGTTNNKNIKLKFKVIDTGIGMSEEKKSKIFTEFEQGDNTTSKKFGGTGLGLVISKKLANLMNGDISFTSQENVGSEFVFQVCVAKHDESEATIDTDYSIEPNSQIVIVSEGSEQSLYIKKLLERKNCRINLIKPESWKQAIRTIDDTYRFILDWNHIAAGMNLIKDIADNKALFEKTALLISEYTENDLVNMFPQFNIGDIQFIPVPFLPTDVYSIIGRFEEKFKPQAEIGDLKLKKSKKCLLVEDNETNQIIANNILSKIGFDVDIAENGFEAVNKVFQNKYDIIIMDIQMPVMDGYEATNRIRRLDAKIPIIGLSAYVLEKEKMFSNSTGFNSHLGKPINIQELYEVVKKYFETEDIDLINSKTKQDTVLNKEMDEKIEVQNFDYLKSNFTDKHMIELLLNSFLETYATIGQDWLNLDANTEDARIKVHTLKGVSGNLHFDNIYELSKNFEKENDPDVKQQMLQSIVTRIGLLNKQIEEELIQLQK